MSELRSPLVSKTRCLTVVQTEVTHLERGAKVQGHVLSGRLRLTQGCWRPQWMIGQDNAVMRGFVMCSSVTELLWRRQIDARQQDHANHDGPSVIFFFFCVL